MARNVDFALVGEKEMIAGLSSMHARTPIALAIAVNQAAKTGVTLAVRGIAKNTKLPVRVVRPKVRLRKARPSSRPEAKISIVARRVRLWHWKWSVLKSGLLKANTGAGRKPYPRAFVQTMPNNVEGIFVRKGKPRLPILQLHGPSIAKVYAEYHDQVAERFRLALPGRLQYQLQRITPK